VSVSIEVNIKKHIGKFFLQVDLRSEGGITGLLGASGCGKSMTLKCISGIIKPDEGKIVLNGRTVFDSEKKINLPPQKRHAGFLFQNYALFPNMTVEQNISCGLPDEKDGEKKQNAVREVICAMQLTGLEKRKPFQLSGGQQQRAALARILVGKPDVLLLDEPFSALDAFLREQMITELKNVLADFGKDSIIVTHNRDEAYELCTDLAVMNNGRLAEKGKTKEVFDYPATKTGAVLTGCKNIVRAVKCGKMEVQVPEWNVRFDVGRPVEDTVSMIGIRAHYFYPDMAENAEKITVLEQIEEPFAWIIRFRFENQDQESDPVWWRVSKEKYDPDHPVRALGISPADIMLLREE